jgi:hypothetical protein
MSAVRRRSHGANLGALLEEHSKLPVADDVRIGEVAGTVRSSVVA